ncbi:MAG: glycosyltransferase [Pirellulaceae bacterium]
MQATEIQPRRSTLDQDALPAMQQLPANGRRAPITAVVIPCYRVTRQISDVLGEIPECVTWIFCVDDCCPDGSSEVIEAVAKEDCRIRLLRNEENQGVGGAVLAGYAAAVAAGADIIVKLDGDGQMDPRRIAHLIAPIVEGQADYVKGNRFFHPEDARGMPLVRLIGNAGLSFITKMSTGYWDLFDPTNGYTAICATVAAALPSHKIARRYFFETDVLFRLGLLRAVVVDQPMPCRYEDEESNLNVWRALVEFPWLHACNTLKRIYYNYFLRNFSIASLNLILGMLLIVSGATIGVVQWRLHSLASEYASAGTVMLAAMPILLGVQLLMNFLAHDMAGTPRAPISRRLPRSGRAYTP